MTEYLSRQEIFDKVASHLLTQGKQSTDLDGNCLYRRADGLKCAIGCLIPDELYDVEMEGADIAMLAERIPGTLKAIGLSPVDFNYAGSLQLIHDSYSPEHWVAQLYRMARDFGLKDSVLKEFK